MFINLNYNTLYNCYYIMNYNEYFNIYDELMYNKFINNLYKNVHKYLDNFLFYLL